MKRLVTLGVVVGVATASCSHGMGTLLPPSASGSQPAQPSTVGARTVVPQSVAAVPAGWAATSTGAMTLANATDLGPLSASHPVNVVLALQLRNASGIQSTIASGVPITRSAFVAQFAPSAAQVSAATSYLQSHGFTNVQTAPNNMLITATASAANVQQAFNTTLHGFSVLGKTYYANTKPALVPTSLGGNVVAVLGLTNVPAVQVHHPSQPGGSITPARFDAQGKPSPTACTGNVNGVTGTTACPRFYDPPTYALTYDEATTTPATGTEIAIFTEGDTSVAVSDFRFNEKEFGLPQVPVNLIHVEPQSTDTSGNSEWTLDMTYSTGLAYSVKRLDLYNVASLAFSDLVVALNRWAADDIAPVMNASVGGCELFPYESGDMVAGDMVLAEAAAQGQTLFASTGDTGAYCGAAGVPPNGSVGGAPFVEWPASSPYAVAVGGTDLFSNADGSYLGEQAWQSGGGGLSQFEYSPYWEQGVQPVGTTPAGLTFRGVPDIAFDAALETGALLYQGGAQFITGGTSLASPIAAGIYARLETAHGNHLPFAALRYYTTYAHSTTGSPQTGPPATQPVGPFHDVLQGTNGLYTALPNYDYTTGLGSIDVARLFAAVK